MIQWMHTLSKSWMATLLMGGLTLSFVVWGIADVFTGGSTAGVASVGSTEITPEMAQRMGLGQIALQQMVSRTALNNEAQQLGLTASDTAVAQNVRAMASFRGTLG